MRAPVAVLPLLLYATSATAQPRTTLDIYVIDVEGGNSTLFVTPLGESVLIDTGNANGAARDAGRIMEAVKDAGLTQIDHLILTHYHGDHFGGMEELSKQIPIKEFIDHGSNMQEGAGAAWEKNVYPKLYANAKHRVVKPGERVELKGVEWRIVAAAGATIAPTAIPGANNSNDECAKFQVAQANAEDPMSVGSYIALGNFRTVHLGDLTRNQEYQLMCPKTALPPVGLFIASQHGSDGANSPLLVHALRPLAVVMNNGTRKGAQPQTMMSLYSSPGLEDVWQMHFSLLSGQEYTTPGMFIANSTDEPLTAMPIAAIQAPAPGPGAAPPPPHNGSAYWVKVSAQSDGTFTVTNARNGFAKTYRAR